MQMLSCRLLARICEIQRYAKKNARVLSDHILMQTEEWLTFEFV